jgi:adenine phosphoribosyltransferase
MHDLIKFIRDIPDFPKPGIMFKDITPLLKNPQALRRTLELLAEQAARCRPDLIVGIESRGFVFGAPLADRLEVGFIPVRKPGKLPYRCVRDEYSLEYGTGVLEMHEDALEGRRALIVDDLLATGGTAACTARLCERQGGHVVGFSFVIELSFLGGRSALGERPVSSLITY